MGVVALTAVVFLFGGGAATAGAAVTEIVTVIAVTAGVLTVAGAGVLGWWVLRGKPRGMARAEAARLDRQAAREMEYARRDALQHQRDLELAAASRTVIHNVIDPAALLAAAQYQPQPARVLRGEVER